MRNLAWMWVLAACLLGCGGRNAKDKAVPAADTAVALPDTVASVFDTTTTFTDSRDGKVYKIVKIGSQTWFAENLNYAAEGSKCYGENGKTAIGYKDHKKITTTLSNAEVQANCAKYGRLYTWETAKKACPDGTHLPTDMEWSALVDYADAEKTAKLKSKAGWNNNGNGTDDYGWSALPGGLGYSDGNFSDAGRYGSWWSATENDAYNASSRYMDYGHDYVYWLNFNKAYLFSVRCVQDDEKERRK
jgi:uncharacterized protein (TIGR02145 family)